MITEDQINAAYENLARALSQAHSAACAEVDARHALERQKMIALANGRIDGKNAELREAAAQQFFTPLYDKLEQAERAASDARLALQLAQLEVERARALLRVAELAAGVTQ